MWRNTIVILAVGLLLFACQPEKEPEQNTNDTENKTETPPASSEMGPETETAPLPAPEGPENSGPQKSPSTPSRQTETRPGTSAPREMPEAPPAPAPVRRLRQTYAEVRPGYRGLSLVKQDGKYGYVDTLGLEWMAPQFDYAEDFTLPLVRVRKKDKVGLLNTEGKLVVPMEYRFIDKYNRGVAKVVREDGTFFYVDGQGQYLGEKIDDYSEGLALIRKGKKIGYINDHGKLITAIQYDFGTRFKNGEAEVKQNGHHFYINREGRCIRDCP